jgi:hypothetical protein
VMETIQCPLSLRLGSFYEASEKCVARSSAAQDVNILRPCRTSQTGLTFEGEISEMYKGTRADESPMPTPTKTRPATIAANPVAVAESSAPTNMGTAEAMSAFLRPSESARPLPVRLPTAAPARQAETTCRGQF